MRLGFFLANLLGFQAVWFAGVLGAVHGLPWAGPLTALLFIIAHFIWKSDRHSDLRMLAIALPIGLAADSLLAASGMLVYASPWPSPLLAPPWILAMWAGFALTMQHSMGFLRGRWITAAIFGLIGGPLTYWGAAQGFGAVEFKAPLPLALATLGVIWGIALPAMYALHAASRRPPPCQGVAA